MKLTKFKRPLKTFLSETIKISKKRFFLQIFSEIPVEWTLICISCHQNYKVNYSLILSRKTPPKICGMAVTGLLGYILKTIGLLYAQPLEGIGRVEHVQIATFIFQPPNKHIVGNIRIRLMFTS